jgi:hypothetical protein
MYLAFAFAFGAVAAYRQPAMSKTHGGLLNRANNTSS